MSGSTKTSGKCWVPWCQWDRWYHIFGRRDQLHRWTSDEPCDGRFRWRHFGRHLICNTCGADGT